MKTIILTTKEIGVLMSLFYQIDKQDLDDEGDIFIEHSSDPKKCFYLDSDDLKVLQEINNKIDPLKQK